MVPLTFEQWVHCIALDCGIPLSKEFIQKHLQVYQNSRTLKQKNSPCSTESSTSTTSFKGYNKLPNPQKRILGFFPIYVTGKTPFKTSKSIIFETENLLVRKLF